MPGRKRRPNAPLTVFADKWRRKDNSDWRGMSKKSVDRDVSGKAGAVIGASRRRVRTPGKHIVLFGLAVTFMLTLSTTALRSGRLHLPNYNAANADAPDDGKRYSQSEEFTVDLSPDGSGRQSFLNMKIAITAADRASLEEITAKQAAIRERLSFFLRELSADDFDGTDAMARVKAEMLKRIQLALDDGAASDVVIENIIIQ